ncbi:MAG: hypothetical protein V7K48_09010 [Nostoc sp.]|uniref:hypothetical protein n=1 Tax=Nostoc sp. TaxID=1180 RepID=UPI002FF81386
MSDRLELLSAIARSQQHDHQKQSLNCSSVVFGSNSDRIHQIITTIVNLGILMEN